MASDAVETLIDIYTKGQIGIFHCSGRGYTTRIKFTKKVAKIFGLDEKMISSSFRDKNDLSEWIGGNLRLAKEICLDVTETEKNLIEKT
ncbi:MAG: hypothetical protein PHW73_06030 [Atribacterota bacterium]|nr:hypothetical protein [Atribacterota bacterium]